MKPDMHTDANETIELMRLVHDELPAERAQALRQRMTREPALAERYQRQAAAWQQLVLPPPGPVPPGFTGRVMAHARERAAAAAAARSGIPLRWSAMPRWVRATGAAALLAGALLGAGLGHGVAGEPGDESYWTAGDEPQTVPAAEPNLPALPAPPRGEGVR